VVITFIDPYSILYRITVLALAFNIIPLDDTSCVFLLASYYLCGYISVLLRYLHGPGVPEQSAGQPLPVKDVLQRCDVLYGVRYDLFEVE